MSREYNQPTYGNVSIRVFLFLSLVLSFSALETLACNPASRAFSFYSRLLFSLFLPTRLQHNSSVLAVALALAVHSTPLYASGMKGKESIFSSE